MNEIAVSDNMVVEYDDKQWRLIRINDAGERNRVAAVEGDGRFRYNSFFAMTRILPDEGEILADDIDEVILGWSHQTDAWQLCLVLSADLAAGRSDAGCEVLRFIDPDMLMYEQDAIQAGQALADVLGKPFVHAPPVLAPAPPPIPLADLPLEVGIWRLQAGEAAGSGSGEVWFVRSKSWMRGKLRQIAWYGLFVVLYVWVSIASMSSELALPNAGTLIPDPQFLPYLGLGVAALLMLMILQQLWQIMREPDRILISAYVGSVVARRGDRMRWQVNAKSVQSIYASELVKKRGRRPAVHHSEINLHLVNGRFQRMIIEDAKLMDAWLPDVNLEAEKGRAVGVNVLEPQAASTALQAAAVHISVCLDGLPVWYDRRYK